MKSLRALCLVLLASCGGTSVQDFQTQASAAKACGDTDTCQNAGASPCLCATAVVSSKAASIDALAAMVSCGGATVQCQQSTNPRCDHGTCVSDLR